MREGPKAVSALAREGLEAAAALVREGLEAASALASGDTEVAAVLVAEGLIMRAPMRESMAAASPVRAASGPACPAAEHGPRDVSGLTR